MNNSRNCQQFPGSYSTLLAYLASTSHARLHTMQDNERQQYSNAILTVQTLLIKKSIKGIGRDATISVLERQPWKFGFGRDYQMSHGEAETLTS